MPASEPGKHVPHPHRTAHTDGALSPGGAPRPYTRFAELCVTSNATFLTGASHPEEFIREAASLGYEALAVADLHTLGGIVRAHVAAKELPEHARTRFVPAARVRPTDMDGLAVCLYPTDMAAYRRLCRMLTIGKRRAAKGQCTLTSDDLRDFSAGLLAIAMPDDSLSMEPLRAHLRALASIYDDDRLSLGARMSFRHDDVDRLELLQLTSQACGVPLVATNDPHANRADRRMLQDVLTCIRLRCSLAEAGRRLHPNSERHLKHPDEMARLFSGDPDAVARSVAIAERARGFSLDELRYQYPDEVVPAGCTPMGHLRDLTEQGTRERYPGGVPAKVRAQIEHEMELIEDLDYARYFLTVYDLVRFARSGAENPGADPPQGWQGEILCQGRGAAANSAVCYCLGVTAVDPARIDVLFERFISKERNEPPDIDIDFEHERREEVIQYIYRKYGRDRAALTAEVITYRPRSAVRDVGKALGLSLDLVDRLAKDIEWWDEGGVNGAKLKALGLNPDDPALQWLARLTKEILGFPRHRSQHVGGFVITRTPLCELVPIENAAMPDRTVVEWDKDDIDAMGMLKVDVLGLGMLTCIRKALALVNNKRARESPAQPALTLATIPPEDPATYAMIQKADTLGVFQIESRAQMSMLPRLKPREFYDLVIEVAIVRPGPIQGDMVHPYLRRRNGEEPVEYAHPAIEQVLKKTLGVPLFQEQCMALAVKAAGFTPGQADELRRSMAAWKRKGHLIHRFGMQLIDGMMSNGIPREFAERCFEQIKGFSEYGFPESHAASFALLVYASCWLKKHHPAEFAAALLNSQPMGFYAPAQIVRDVKAHGVRVLPIDVNRSAWDCTIERGAMRLGMRLVNGLGKPDADLIRGAVVQRGAMKDLTTLWRISGVSAKALRRLASADAFESMGLKRREAIWQARLLRDDPMPLFAGLSEPPPSDAERASIPEITARGAVVQDYQTIGLSLKGHPMQSRCDEVRAAGAVPCGWLSDATKTPDGLAVRVAGIVLMRQRPGTAGGVTFMTLEDETGIANLIIWQRVYQRYRKQARTGTVLAIGRVQRQGEVVHVIVTKLRSLDALTGSTSVVSARRPLVRSRDFH
ncbi:MAG: error-prone DNA polymerase [Phycisphaerales bacterium]|nr:error-prone DNA polymerase [Phycisphaerales bacterium]